MRKFYLSFLIAVAILLSFCANAQDFSNKGRDFWVGYGYHEQMTNTSTAGGSQNMLLYFATDVVTTVTVDIPGLGWTQTYTNIPANTVFASNPMPKSTPDARLNVEGLSSKGIHITADHPIIAYAHIYNQSVSGATILYPTNTLGREYYSVNYTNNSNTNNANCFFYVVAADTGTTSVEITPSAATTGGWTANSVHTVTLTQGQVYNVMGTTNGTSGVDLTGSTIRSVSNGLNGCKKIAVYSGSGRIGIVCSGAINSSDNYMVQAMPKSAWGKHFLTVPCAYYNAVSGDGTPLTPNIYRICVDNPATNVTLNGSPIGVSLTNNFYYQVSSTNAPLKIDADGPIMVAQYFPSANACGAGGNDGDPETIYLSPIEQSISTVRWNACNNYAINSNKDWINVIIPSGGTAISSFKLDGVPVSPTIFYPHPQDPNYSYAVIHVSGGPGTYGAGTQHIVTSDSGFNAIAYGFGNFESYGYNAGTNIRDLYQFLQVHNPNAVVNFPAACQGRYFNLSIVLPYNPTQLTWNLTSIGYGITTQGPSPQPVYDSSWVVNGKTLYRYQAPANPYIYYGTGTFPVTVTAVNPTSDNCNGIQEIYYDLQIFPPPVVNFTFNPTSGCLSDSVHFFGTVTNTGGRPIDHYYWDLGDATTSAQQNPVHLYPIPATYLVKFTAMTDVGCVADTTTQFVVINQPPTANFVVTGPTCAGQPVTFLDNSSANGPSPVNNWQWNFADPASGVNNTSSLQNPTHTFSAPGTYLVTLKVRTAAGCYSTVYTQAVTISARPVANFSFTGACLPSGFIQFTDQSTPTGTIQSWIWNFGDGSPTSTLQNPTHNYASAGPFNVQLHVVSNAGCFHDTMEIMNTVYAQPVASFTVDNTTVCSGTTIHVNSTSTASGSTVQTYYWNFGDGSATQSMNHADTSHIYTTPGTYIVKHWVQSAALCVSDTSYRTISVAAIPTASFTVSNPLCATQAVTFTSNSTPGIGNSSITSFNWSVNGTAVGTGNPFTYTFASGGTYTIGLSVTSNNNCVGQTTQTITVNAMPVANFSFTGACLPSGLTQFTDQTTPLGIISNWSWNFGDGSPLGTGQNPTHNYASTGPFNVTLTVTSNSGCIDDSMKVMNVVYAQPHADFTMDSATSCAGNTVHFTDNLSTAPSSSVTTWSWNFGDGSPVYTGTNAALYQNPSHLYATPGVYQVKHWVTSAAGCPSDTMTKTVTVVPLPTASFTVSTPLCATQSVTLTSTSTAGSGTISNLSWTINGSPAGTGSTISFVPNASGNYTIVLTVTTNNNCNAQSTQTINVNTMPVANFSFTGACLPSGYTQFTNQTTPAALGISNYSWNFGDGSPILNGNNPNPTHNYASTGPFNVTLTVTSTNGCIDDSMKVMDVVYAQPHADFTIDSATSCAGNTVHFTDNLSTATNSSITTWSWNFGDGSPVWSGTNPAQYQNPTHLYATPGTYQVKHWVTSAAGCPSDTMTKTVTVVPLPTASFTHTPLLCALESITFTSTSTPNFGTINSYSWTINGSPAGNAASFSYTPAAAGNYTVVLTITTSNNCTSQTTQVLNVNAHPVANFTFGNGCLPSGQVQFTNTSSVSGGSISTNSWNFGDPPSGVNNTSSALNPTHNYSNVGPFNVHLTVTSNNGCTADTFKSVNTVYAQPHADFAMDSATSCAGNTVHFTDNISTAPGSNVTSWNWNFGDPASGSNNTSTSQNPIHLYTTPGTYQVKHWLTSAAGCPSDTMTKTVTVVPLPTASFTHTPLLCALESITFTSTSTPNFGTINSYSWTINGLPASNAPTFSYIPSAAGNYTVVLTITTSNNCTSQATQVLNVNAHPVADFTFGNGCLPTGQVQFTNTSSVSSGTIATNSWNFGDPPSGVNNTSAIASPTHNYSNVGPFNVHLTVTSNNGCTADTFKSVNTVYAQPQAAFNYPTEVCTGSSANFTDISTAPNSSVTGWSWNFGDGSPVNTTQNPSHTYATAGTYLVTLVVTSAQGCTSTTATHNVVVNPLPTASFTISSPNCLNSAITFTDASSANVGTLSTWSWNFGDGGNASTQNPTHTYATVGTFNATLQVTNTKGCSSTVFTLPVTVHELPSVNFTSTTGCVNDIINFTDGSTVANGSVTGWNWNFGDGSPANTTQNPGHLFPSAIAYNVTLTATSNFGCTSSITKPFTPAGMVNTNFNIQGGATTYCSGSTINLTDNSTVNPGAITKVEIYWDYTNNPALKTTDNAPVVGTLYSHTYPEFGSPASQNVTIRYYSYSGNSCSQYKEQVITLKATPTVYFNSVNGICADVPAFQITQAGISNVLPGTGVFSGPGVSPSGVFNPATAGAGTQTIRYTYTAANGCSNYKDQTIDVYPVPIADAGPDRPMIEGGQVTLTPNTNYGYPVTYLWTPGTYLDNPNVANPKASPPFDFTYTLRVTSDKGCSTIDQIFVKILKNPVIPNIFSPNGDGVHDQWIIPYLNTYPGCTVDVFNRYGQLIFHSIGYNTPWDGTVNGKPVPVGTYYYVIDPKNGRSKMSGYVDVIR